MTFKWSTDGPRMNWAGREFWKISPMIPLAIDRPAQRANSTPFRSVTVTTEFFRLEKSLVGYEPSPDHHKKYPIRFAHLCLTPPPTSLLQVSSKRPQSYTTKKYSNGSYHPEDGTARGGRSDDSRKIEGRSADPLSQSLPAQDIRRIKDQHKVGHV